MLTEKDLKSIKGLVDESIESNNIKLIEEVRDIVDFSAEKTEISLTDKLTEKIEDSETGLRKEISDFRIEMSREITDICEMNREFLDKLGDHENRIGKLELKTGLATK